jgi:hypothetical protein
MPAFRFHRKKEHGKGKSLGLKGFFLRWNFYGIFWPVTGPNSGGAFMPRPQQAEFVVYLSERILSF